MASRQLFRRRSKLNRITGFQWILTLCMTALAVFMLLPIVYLFGNALKPYHELFLYPPTFLAKDPTLDNFYDLLIVTKSSIVPVTRYIFNGVVVSLMTILIGTVISSMCAYSLSKHQFYGKGKLFSLIILSLMFAPETVGIPRYFVISKLGIINTYWAHILPALALPVIVFLFKQFIDLLPNELLEAARLEGANEFKVFLTIIIPLCLPAVATATILIFQSSWNNLETSALYIEDETLKTLPFYVQTMTSGLANSVARQGVAAAVALLMFVPNFILFLFMQRKVISTMAHSGLK
ncbi:carbohydrate ABC transporter permease [Paenibacillus aurantius]|uniref:Carbohydrate ABC transporter permease n=1 Tax=Paenibacillus aurantius TaxID=2918900 RepID=A0AA96L8I2_9BACL|nr:carbohydrate ABC transporter permease [Paenibacillus aurantius]WNQ08991.1 carbohydrate ABC transporter permease [Paenibacillus aurantius]